VRGRNSPPSGGGRPTSGTQVMRPGPGGVGLRCLTWWRAVDLDSRLAGGADPMHSDALRLRVGSSLGGVRESLACALRGAVEVANRPHDPTARRRLPGWLRRAEWVSGPMALGLLGNCATRGTQGLALRERHLSAPTGGGGICPDRRRGRQLGRRRGGGPAGRALVARARRPARVRIRAPRAPLPRSDSPTTSVASTPRSGPGGAP
jgi:hypothetical protein